MVNIVNLSGASIRKNFNLGSMPKGIFLLAGLLVIVVGVFLVLDGQKTAAWPVTSAVIRDVDSEVTYDSEGNQQTAYRYVLVYTVDGVEHSKRERSNNYVNANSQMTVAYNPSDPNDIRVGGSRSWLGWVVVGVGVVLTVFFIVRLIGGSRRESIGAQPPSVQMPTQAAPLAPTPEQQPPQPSQVPTSSDKPLGL